MDLQKLGWDLDRIDLAQDRDRWGGALVNPVMNLRIPYNTTDCSTTS